MDFAGVVDSPLGRIGIRLAEGRLAGLDLVDPATPLQAPAEPLTEQVVDQLARYFDVEGGAMITEVVKDGPAWKSGILDKVI